MSKPIALITADWHLTHNAWKWRPNLYGDALFGLQQICKTASHYGLPIIAAGDMFDVKRPPLQILLDAKLIIDNTEGYYIQGNHDKTTPSWMSLISSDTSWWDIVRDTPVLGPSRCPSVPDTGEWTKERDPSFLKPVNKWTLYGIHYVGSREQLQTELDQLPELNESGVGNILVLHQSCSEVFPMGEPELIDGMIPNDYDLVICGHYHKAMLASIKTKSGDSVPCLSPGGTHLLSIAEDPSKKIYMFCDDGAIYSKKLITRRVIRQDVQNATESEIRQSLVGLVQALKKKKTVKRPPEIDTPIVYVIYNSATVETLKSIVDTTLKSEGVAAHIFYKDISEKDSYEIEFADNTEFSATISTGFEYARDVFLQSEQDSNIRRIVESMLDTEPSQESYEQIKNTFLGETNA
jgi:DNA repair exonuclease SbcCD nuclease subunit